MSEKVDPESAAALLECMLRVEREANAWKGKNGLVCGLCFEALAKLVKATSVVRLDAPAQSDGDGDE